MIRKLIVVLLSGVFCLLGLTAALAATYNESPMLRTLVAAGELPPLEERLPEEPFVVDDGVQVPKEDLDFKIGRYGGTLRMLEPWGNWWQFATEQLLSQPGFGMPDKEPEGGILKGFTVSPDGKVFTFFLRKGLKWSDGVPVTTEDIRFGYEDVLQNEEITPVFPPALTSGGEPGKLEIVDDYTFRIGFVESYGLFPQQLSFRWRSYENTGLYPAHYLKRFHPRYTPIEKLRPLLEEAGLRDEEWGQYFLKNAWGVPGNLTQSVIGAPSLSPYIVVDRPSLTVIMTERNPYYWKVDSAGNQLPYIDKVRWELVPNEEVRKMKILTGEAQFLETGQPTAAEMSLFKEGEEKGGYRMVPLLFHCFDTYMFNYGYPDEVWSKIVRDVRFRKALSLAINREEIVDTIFGGFAKPSYTFPGEYNPTKANQLLDEMGLERDAEGWCLRPDDKRLELVIELPTYGNVPVTEMITESWEKIGIKTMMKVQGGRFYWTRLAAGEVQVGWNLMDIPVIRDNLAMWVDYKVGGAGGGIGYDIWYNTEGKKGIEPPAEIRKIYEVAWMIRKSSSVEERYELFQQSVRWINDEVFFIMPVEDTFAPIIAAKNLGNIPAKGYCKMVFYVPEQLFFKQ